MITRLRMAAVLGAAVCILGGEAWAQTATPTATPTNTPTNTPTATAVVAATATAVATATPNAMPVNGQLIGNTRADGNIAVRDGSVIVYSQSDGGSVGKVSRVVGVLKAEFVALGAMTNGATESTAFIDASPAGEWTAHDSDVVVSTDSTIYRTGTTSLKLAFGGGATDQDGAVNDITNDDWEANESFGVWVFVSEAMAAGDLALWTEDTSANVRFTFPVIPRARVWQFIELPIGSLAGGTGNVVNKIHFILTTQGATNHDAFTINLSQAYKWDAADEEALSQDVICSTGSVKLSAIPTLAATDNTQTVPTENTDFLLICRGGNDSIVTLTDQSANSGLAFVAVQ